MRLTHNFVYKIRDDATMKITNLNDWQVIAEVMPAKITITTENCHALHRYLHSESH